jgi:2-C-methyl-D-erythritol 4-phosphate cytidylyltransferase
MNVGIIVAGGQGKRFGAEKPKQFVEIYGKPLIIHTLERFEDCPLIDEIFLILPVEEIEDFQKNIEEFNLKKLKKIISGGETRSASVRNGLRAAASKAVEIIAVHDGARPLVSGDEITATIEKAKEAGAACLVVSVNDTIKEVSGDKIIKTIDRSTLRRALTPQAFRSEILQRAFMPDNFDKTATDECFLVEKLGIEIAFVEGSGKNIKITTPEDLILAQSLLKETKT